MQVLFTSQDAEGDKLRDLVVQRVRFVMRRMTWLVPKATVELSDVDGTGGGIDKRCLVEFKTDRGGSVVITVGPSSSSAGVRVGGYSTGGEG